MRLLGIDTSGQTLSAAIVRDGVLEGEMTCEVPSRHSVVLLPAIERLLETARCTLSALDGLCVTAGPGSFTGVRIGAATMSAMAFALSVPVYPVSTLDALIAVSPPSLCVCAMLDARRSEVYVKAVREGRVIISESALSVEDVLVALGEEEKPYFTGDGARVYQGVIRARFPQAVFLPAAVRENAALGACLLAAEGAAAPAEGGVIHPVYLRVPQAQRERDERRRREEET